MTKSPHSRASFLARDQRLSCRSRAKPAAGGKGPAVHAPRFPVIRRVFAAVARAMPVQAFGHVPRLPDVVGVVGVLEDVDPHEA